MKTLFEQAQEFAKNGDAKGLAVIFNKMLDKADTDFEESIAKANMTTCQQMLIGKLIGDAEKACEEKRYSEMETIFQEAFDYVINRVISSDEEQKAQKYRIKNSVEKCFKQIAVLEGIDKAEEIIRGSKLLSDAEITDLIIKCDKAVKDR